jgi:hypothetical protein
MVIRDVTYYAFTTSAAPSVFSSETHLSWHWYLLQSNSQDLWRAQCAKIRLSISLDTEPYSECCDTPIGITLTLLRNTNKDQWCDYCKQRWGSHKNQWHPNAMKMAYWKCVSAGPNRKSQVRFYCLECAADLQNWPDGSFYSLKEQLLDGLGEVAKRENLNVELPR